MVIRNLHKVVPLENITAEMCAHVSLAPNPTCFSIDGAAPVKMGCAPSTEVLLRLKAKMT